MKKSILPVIPVLILILLLMRPALAFDGAKSGLLLWFNVVLPTLLPFMLCSSLLVAWGGVPLITRPFAPLFRLLGLSDKLCSDVRTVMRLSHGRKNNCRFCP